MILDDQASGAQLDLGAVDADLDLGLLGVEITVRGSEEEASEFDFETRLTLNARHSGEGVFRIGRLRLDQWRSWLPEEARLLIGQLPDNANAQVEAKLSWEKQALSSADVRFVLEQPDAVLDWRHLSGALHWQAAAGDHAVALEHLSLDEVSVAGDVHIRHSGTRTRGVLKHLDIRGIRRLAAAVGVPLDDLLPDGIISGVLRQAEGDFRWREPLQYNFRSDIDGLGISDDNNDFLLTGLGGGIMASERGIQIRLDSGDVAVSYAPWHLDNFHPGQTSFQLHWWPGPSCCEFRLTDLQVESPVLKLHGAASMSGIGSSDFRADLRIDHAYLPTVSQWLPPDLLAEADERWVKNAFKAGRLEGARLRINGDISTGVLNELLLVGNVRGVDLDYEPGLPMFMDVEGRLLIDRASMHMLVETAKFMDSELTNGAVRMEDLGLMNMYASATVSGPTGDLPTFLEKVDWMDPMFNEVLVFSGDTILDAAINLPLDDRLEHKVSARGILRFQDNQLDVVANDTRLEALAGELRYAGRELSGQLGARFLGQPVHIQLATAPSEDLEIKMQVMAAPPDFLPEELRHTLSWIEGNPPGI